MHRNYYHYSAYHSLYTRKGNECEILTQQEVDDLGKYDMATKTEVFKDYKGNIITYFQRSSNQKEEYKYYNLSKNNFIIKLESNFEGGSIVIIVRRRII